MIIITNTKQIFYTKLPLKKGDYDDETRDTNPEDVPIGTRIITEHIVLLNDNGTDIVYKNDVMWTVDYRRSFSDEFGPQIPNT